ncbi:NUDIX hydrolase [Streptomyces sp. NP160]|uniref:NUDIX domain-containing protein n=1 Tax=Streptomyces sp. NP160 TaxID=2586637 RepID=UPI00214CFBD8|nr:NUDIX hydrolase [Streptomyces sp. NP160]
MTPAAGTGGAGGGLPASATAGAFGAPRDELVTAAPRTSEVLHRGYVWDLVRDVVDLEGVAGGALGAGTVTRELLRHPGAVGVLALDDDERILLVRQYRHPVEHLLWELPAGLLDVAGEPPHLAAARELAEEADLRAGTYHVLLDWFLSPGGSDEAFRLFLARDLSPVPEAERHHREAEEAGMVSTWVPLEAARDAVLAGDLNSPSLVAGVLAAWAARERGWSELRPLDAPWPQHRAYR